MKKEDLSLYIKGCCMGIADLVPGVSGGSIAFILGIYQDFLNALQFFHWRFLFCLGLGILSSIMALARVVGFFLENYPVYLWSFFMGLILTSVPFLLLRTEKTSFWFLLPGVLGGYFLTGLIPVETPHTPLFIGLSGFIAMAAMILPGISGSFLLLILGKYEFIISVLKNPFSQLWAVGSFAVGAGLSLLCLSRFLNKMFKKYPSAMSFFFGGFLLGSLRKVWPWKNEIRYAMVNGKKKVLEAHNILPSDLGEVPMALFMTFVGIMAIVLLEYGSRRAKKTA